MHSRAGTRVPPSVLFVFLPWLLVIPVIWLDRSSSIDGFSLPPSFVHSLARSIALATVAAAISVALGLGFAWICRDVKGSYAEQLLACLMLPVLLGQIAIGFLAKLTVLRAPIVGALIADRNEWLTLLFVLGLYLYKYAPLCAYLLWIRVKSLPSNRSEYAATAHLSQAEVAADVLWPHLRSLCQALFVFVFLVSATEFSITDLSIRPSVGTNTSLLSHWLEEQYRIWLPAGHSLAISELVVYGISGALAILIAALAAQSLLLVGVDALASVHFGVPCRDVRATTSRRSHSTYGWVVGGVAMGACIAPLAWGYVVFPPRVLGSAFLTLLAAAGWALFGSVVCVLISISMAVCLRWQTRRNSFGPLRSSWLYLAVMSSLAVPQLLFSLAAFRWFGTVVSFGVVATLSAWLVGEVLASMPLLVAFAYWAHQRVGDIELDYQTTIGVRNHELFKSSFLDRLKSEYLLISLFAWSLVWNDGTINRGASSDIPSLYALIAPKLSVRPDYGAAQFFLLLSLAVASAMILVWSQLQRRVTR